MVLHVDMVALVRPIQDIDGRIRQSRDNKGDEHEEGSKETWERHSDQSFRTCRFRQDSVTWEKGNDEET